MRTDSAARQDLSGQAMVGGGLLLEAALWSGLSVWAAWRWRSMGAPAAYIVESLVWIAPAIPIAVSGLVLLRRGPEAGLRPGVIACLAWTVLMNLGVAAFSLLGGALNGSMAPPSRVFFLLIGMAATTLLVRVAHDLRGRLVIEHANKRLSGYVDNR
jgi:uncharacterized membrane protein YuzA (DUF378 family)